MSSRKNQITRHYQKQLARFEEYFHKTLESQEIEDLHQMRVSIKWLRAIWSLMQVVSSGEWIKKAHYQMIKDLFKTGGRLREAQVNLNLIEKFQAVYLFPYAEFVVRAEKHFGKDLMVCMQQFDLNGLDVLNEDLFLRMSKMQDEVVLRVAAAFILKKNRKVMILKDQLPDNHKLHKIRKHLKAVQELLMIIGELNPDEVPNMLHQHILTLNHKIGKWHDYSVLLNSIQQFLDETPSENDKLINGLIDRINSQQMERQDNINVLLEEYFSQQQLKHIEDLASA